MREIKIVRGEYKGDIISRAEEAIRKLLKIKKYDDELDSAEGIILVIEFIKEEK